MWLKKISMYLSGKYLKKVNKMMEHNISIFVECEGSKITVNENEALYTKF